VYNDDQRQFIITDTIYHTWIPKREETQTYNTNTFGTSKSMCIRETIRSHAAEGTRTSRLCWTWGRQWESRFVTLVPRRGPLPAQSWIRNVYAASSSSRTYTARRISLPTIPVNWHITWWTWLMRQGPTVCV